MSLQVLVTLTFLASSGTVIGLYLLLAGRSEAAMRKNVEDRLRDVTSLSGLDDEDAPAVIREQSTGALPALDRAARRAFGSWSFERWIEQSGVHISVGGVLIAAGVCGLIAMLVATMLTQRLWAGALAFVVAAALPFAFLKYRRSSRLYTFEEHFPEALDLMSRAVRAGHAFGAGMKMVADEMRTPVGPEFRKAFDEQNYGLPLKESLHNLAGRVPLLDVQFFATAVLIQRDTGGNLAEILDNLAAVVRERFKIRRQVRVHTAHGRMTGYVLLALPAFLAMALSVINPEHMQSLFRDPIGQTLVVSGIGMQIVGWIWIRQVVKIEV